MGSAPDREGQLFALRFFDSHEKFLRFVRRGKATSRHQVTRNIMDQYAAVRACYEALVADLEGGKDITRPVDTCDVVDWSVFRVPAQKDEGLKT